jgi:prepilin-type N-terminal cleavage/methylation domain-containing protein
MKTIQKNTRESGFTLIELLVVIAIIGILATIVLTSLGSARSEANDAKVQAQLSSMRAQAELYYGTAADYGSPITTSGGVDVCRNAGGGGSTSGTLFQSGTVDGLFSLFDSMPAGYEVSCYTDPGGPGSGASATAWAVSVKNPDSTEYWCTDSTGQSKSYSSGLWVAPTAAICD